MFVFPGVMEVLYNALYFFCVFFGSLEGPVMCCGSGVSDGDEASR